MRFGRLGLATAAFAGCSSANGGGFPLADGGWSDGRGETPPMPEATTAPPAASPEGGAGAEEAGADALAPDATAAPAPDSGADDAMQADAAEAGCVTGQQTCTGSQPMECVDGVWLRNGAPCTDATCVAGSCTGVCAEGAAACVDGGVATCDPTGQWTAPSPCGSSPIGVTCQAGACSCPNAQTACGGVCVDTQNDTNNCGSCGTQCPLDATCQSGTCCQAGQALCGGACVDPQSDPNNCGACGVVCVGSEASCTGGRCISVVVATVERWSDTQGGTLPAGVSALAVDATSVYWLSTGGLVAKAPLDGSARPTTLASGYGVGGLTIDSANVYWASGAGVYSVPLVPLDGGTVTTLATGQTGASSIAVDATNVYWASAGDTNRSNGSVNTIPIGGAGDAGVTALASGQDDVVPPLLAIGPSTLYWSTSSVIPAGGSSEPTYALHAMALDGGSQEILASATGQARGLALDGTWLFWTAGDPRSPSDAGTLTEAPSTAGASTVLAGGLNTAGGVCADGENVYFTTATSVLSIPVGGGPTTIAAQTGDPVGVPIAVDRTSLYWTRALQTTPGTYIWQIVRSTPK